MLKGSQQLVGAVVKEPFGQGSKSAHNAVVFLTEGKRYVLRRDGGNAFHDPTLEALVGKTICGTGRLAGYTFLMSDWNEVEQS